MEIELFVHFAEIAGVFVGFGALISQRSVRPTDPHDVVYLRAVLGLGVWVVTAALVPIAVSRYGVHDDRLWLSCAVATLAIWVIFIFVLNWSADSRRLSRSPERLDRFFPVVGLPLHIVIAGSLVLVIVGVWPRIDEALYVTALAAAVIFAGYTLLALVFSQKSAPGPTEKEDDRQD
jgi:hypothetical protein